VKKPVLSVLPFFLALCAPLVQAADTDTLAVIVNKQTAVMATTSSELKGIFMGIKDKWPNGVKVTAVSLSLDHPETRTWLKEICGMTEQEYRKYFMQMSFQGKTVNTPRLLMSAGQVRSVVASTPGSIGIVPMEEVDGSVNILNLDGTAPGSAGYRLSPK
jgi:hypothetical protein